ncbi:DUF5615 family PIN-like protein [Oscillatoria laete-virens NRMC-F 0139]|nr:DUF5615 family PIN-like protein [Oscillatoria laete-virens]MDL5055353.1 DUF5615 family PIN-like protein [Oscillatoria laete-virens NRMC-F 0139]
MFDENLPRLIRFIPALPVIHATEIGRSVSDRHLWNYARKRELVIVTKDADFRNMILINHPPPWVVQLQIGNMPRNEFHLFCQKIGAKLNPVCLITNSL